MKLNQPVKHSDGNCSSSEPNQETCCSNKIKLLDFIDVIETVLNKKAIRKYLPMQLGDVEATWADVSNLKKLTNFSPSTNFKDGIIQFVKWYREYYNV